MISTPNGVFAGPMTHVVRYPPTGLAPWWPAVRLAASVLRILAGVTIGAVLIIALVGTLLLMALLAPAQAAERTVQIPAISTIYRIKIEHVAARNFGLDAPVARLAAQIHQESAWNPRAESPYAQGLTQFTPSTARWIPGVCPQVGPPDVWDADWSLRAQACYMAWLHARIVPYRYAGGMTDCTRWHFALRGYNGGLGWLNKERLKTQRAGADGNDWRDVERHRVRAGWAHRENIGYPRRILLTLEPAYLLAGWPGKSDCA